MDDTLIAEAAQAAAVAWGGGLRLYVVVWVPDLPGRRLSRPEHHL